MRLTLRAVLLAASVVLVVFGVPVWAHTDMTPGEARELIASTPDLLVVDVREPYEYCDARGHIPGAVNYPLSSGVLQARYEELPMDRPILVVCRSGGRSNVAANFLDSQGFPEVYDMTGGMNAWVGDTVPCKYAGGSGTPDDPYQIATAADLIALGETPEDYDKHFILAAALDLDPNLPDGRVFDRAVIAPDENDDKSFFQGTPFTGVLDGRGYAISHLTIVGHDFLGLIGQLEQGGGVEGDTRIEDLKIAEVSITGSGDYVGGLVGHNDDATISQVSSTGAVTGECMVGGLAGHSGGTMMQCDSICVVVGSSEVGGLVGRTYGTVASCSSSSTVDGTWQVGGLVGFHRGQVTQCYSAGTVSGVDTVGGLIGRNGAVGRRPYPGDIDRSYSVAQVRGETMIGGLMGQHWDGMVRQCYSAGTVSGVESVGGLIGWGDPRDITEAFWDMEASGVTVSVAGEGLTTNEMRTAGTFIDAGWDFIGEPQNGLHEIWQMSVGGGYPILTAFNGYTPPPLRGQGTPEEPYLISDAVELGAVIHYSPDAHYRLTAPIDLSGIRWTTELIPRFSGTFDGDGYTISHLTVAGTNTVGFIGSLDAGAIVKDVGIVDANVVTSSPYITGGLVRYNRGTVTGCYVTGAVGGVFEVGGLVGFNEGKVTCCYADCRVDGEAWVGGLVGHNSGNVTHCYSVGTVRGVSRFGGLIGENDPDDGEVNGCFWDTETSGQAESSAGTGKVTAEMQTAGTFISAGWDFVGEAENGTEEIWWIDEGQDYPRLWWEAGEVEF